MLQATARAGEAKHEVEALVAQAKALQLSSKQVTTLSLLPSVYYCCWGLVGFGSCHQFLVCVHLAGTVFTVVLLQHTAALLALNADVRGCCCMFDALLLSVCWCLVGYCW